MIHKSPWVSFFNSGGCNGCTLEWLACTAPKWDIERFGCLVKESAKQADILVVTGPVTKKCKDRLLQVYSQIAKPKKVIGVGNCTISGCVFKDGYMFEKPLGDIIPVDMYVPGCPPKPEAIIDGILGVLKDAKRGRNKK